MSTASQGQSSSSVMKGPPYPPRGALLGGVPTLSLDAPISGVVIALYLLSFAINMTIYQRNRMRGHKFFPSVVLCGFSMARTAANVMRIVWAAYPNNVNIVIAANVIGNAGVIVLFVVNLILARRIFRAYHPKLGWSKVGNLTFDFLYTSIGAMIIMVIVCVVYSFFTLNMSALTKVHDAQLFATTYLAILAFLPVPLLLVSVFTSPAGPKDSFGTGAMRTKVFLVVMASTLLALGACFRAGVAYYQRPAGHPAWFQHKACYYCFNYLLELIVLFSYALSRFDLRFHIPNGSKQAGDYSSLPDPVIQSVHSDEETIAARANSRMGSGQQQHFELEKREKRLDE